MRQVALVGIVSVVLLTAAACGEQSPADQARNVIEDLLDTVEDDIEEVHEIYQETRAGLGAERDEVSAPCRVRSQAFNEDDASYLNALIPCIHREVLEGTIEVVDQLIAQTRPEAIQQSIEADRIRLEQLTDAEVIDTLATFRAVYSEKQLDWSSYGRMALLGGSGLPRRSAFSGTSAATSSRHCTNAVAGEHYPNNKRRGEAVGENEGRDASPGHPPLNRSAASNGSPCQRSDVCRSDLSCGGLTTGMAVRASELPIVLSRSRGRGGTCGDRLFFSQICSPEVAHRVGGNRRCSAASATPFWTPRFVGASLMQLARMPRSVS